MSSISWHFLHIDLFGRCGQGVAYAFKRWSFVYPRFGNVRVCLEDVGFVCLESLHTLQARCSGETCSCCQVTFFWMCVFRWHFCRCVQVAPVLPCSLAGIASNLVAFEMRIGQLCVSLQCETPPDATARCVLVVRYRIVCSWRASGIFWILDVCFSLNCLKEGVGVVHWIICLFLWLRQ